MTSSGSLTHLCWYQGNLGTLHSPALPACPSICSSHSTPCSLLSKSIVLFGSQHSGPPQWAFPGFHLNLFPWGGCPQSSTLPETLLPFLVSIMPPTLVKASFTVSEHVLPHLLCLFHYKLTQRGTLLYLPPLCTQSLANAVTPSWGWRA